MSSQEEKKRKVFPEKNRKKCFAGDKQKRNVFPDQKGWKLGALTPNVSGRDWRGRTVGWPNQVYLFSMTHSGCSCQGRPASLTQTFNLPSLLPLHCTQISLLFSCTQNSLKLGVTDSLWLSWGQLIQKRRICNPDWKPKLLLLNRDISLCC